MKKVEKTGNIIMAIIVLVLFIVAMNIDTTAPLEQTPTATIEQTLAPGEISNIEFYTNGILINETMVPVTFKVTTYEDGSQTIEAVITQN